MASYVAHSNLVLPDDNSVIWRYMDCFPKFQSMLQNGSIFFSRADKQTDNLEGEYPIGMLDEIERRLGKFKSNDGESYTFSQWHNRKEIPSRLLSCWSVSPSESRRMWCEYTDSLESVAIRSTIGRLKNCFHPEEKIIELSGLEKSVMGMRRINSQKSFSNGKSTTFCTHFLQRRIRIVGKMRLGLLSTSHTKYRQN